MSDCVGLVSLCVTRLCLSHGWPWEKKLCQVSGDQATGQAGQAGQEERVTAAQDDAPSLAGQSLTPPVLGLGRNCLGNPRVGKRAPARVRV